jgi:hypothetical protein
LLVNATQRALLVEPGENCAWLSAAGVWRNGDALGEPSKDSVQMSAPLFASTDTNSSWAPSRDQLVGATRPSD